MSRVFISLVILGINSVAIGQVRQTRVDTFLNANGFSSVYILLCSDSTFFVASNNCTHSNIAKGKWIEQKGKFTLTTERSDQLSVKPDIHSEIATSGDTIVTFEIVDYLEHPIENYTIIFYNQELKEFEFDTDENGKLSIPINSYVGYFTIDDYNHMDFPGELTTGLRFLWNKYSHITLRLNYPISILRQRPNTNPFEYKGGRFTKTTNGLISESGTRFKKL